GVERERERLRRRLAEVDRAAFVEDDVELRLAELDFLVGAALDERLEDEVEGGVHLGRHRRAGRDAALRRARAHAARRAQLPSFARELRLDRQCVEREQAEAAGERGALGFVGLERELPRRAAQRIERDRPGKFQRAHESRPSARSASASASSPARKPASRSLTSATAASDGGDSRKMLRRTAGPRSPSGAAARSAPSRPPSALIIRPICLPTTYSPMPISRSDESMSAKRASVSSAAGARPSSPSASRRSRTSAVSAVIMSKRPSIVSGTCPSRYQKGSRARATFAS